MIPKAMTGTGRCSRCGGKTVLLRRHERKAAWKGHTHWALCNRCVDAQIPWGSRPEPDPREAIERREAGEATESREALQAAFERELEYRR